MEPQKTDTSELVWRDSMVDRYIAVRGYSSDVREKKAEELKDWKPDFDKVVTTNLNSFIDYPNQTFQPKSYVHHPGRNAYVHIKKYDEAKKVYQCRVKEENLGLAIIKCRSDEINNNIEATHQELSD